MALLRLDERHDVQRNVACDAMATQHRKNALDERQVARHLARPRILIVVVVVLGGEHMFQEFHVFLGALHGIHQPGGCRVCYRVHRRYSAQHFHEDLGAETSRSLFA